MRKSAVAGCLRTICAVIIAFCAFGPPAHAGLLSYLGFAETSLDNSRIAILTCEQDGEQVKSCYLAPRAAIPNCIEDISAKRFSCESIAEMLCASGGIQAVDLKGNATGGKQRIDCARML